jgi:hypothetical protein
MRSERWDQPRGASRPPSDLHPATRSGAGGAPNMQRRASASALSPRGVEPQHAQPTVPHPDPAPSHRPAPRQLSSPVIPAAAQHLPSPGHEGAAKPAPLPVPPLRLSSLGTGSSHGNRGRASGAAPATQSSSTRRSARREEQPPHLADSVLAARPVAAAAKLSQGGRPSPAAPRSSAAAARSSALQQPTGRGGGSQPASAAHTPAASPSTGADNGAQSSAQRASGEDAAPQRSPFEQAAQPSPHAANTNEDAAGTEPAAAAPADPTLNQGRRSVQRSVTMDPALETSDSVHAGEHDKTSDQEVRHKPSSCTQSWAAVVAGDDSKETGAPPVAGSAEVRQRPRDSARDAQPAANAQSGPGNGSAAAQVLPPLPGQGATGSGSGSGRSQQVAAA